MRGEGTCKICDTIFLESNELDEVCTAEVAWLDPKDDCGEPTVDWDDPNVDWDDPDEPVEDDTL